MGMVKCHFLVLVLNCAIRVKCFVPLSRKNAIKHYPLCKNKIIMTIIITTAVVTAGNYDQHDFMRSTVLFIVIPPCPFLKDRFLV